MTTQWNDVEQRFPYECRTWHAYDEVQAWCEQQFGAFDDRWYRYGTDMAQGIVAGYPRYDRYRFRDEQAAVLFQLKWS
jgi:hypothetical protein